jgi:glycosyltransferase involved in cell wall biosynthesis
MIHLLGAILPHVKVFGGVKRFLELGNIFENRGIRFIIFTDNIGETDWFDFNGRFDTIKNISNYSLDGLFITEPIFLPYLLNSGAKHKIFYHVIESPILRRVLKYKDIRIFANSSNIYEFIKRRYSYTAFKAYGAVNIEKFWPGEQEEDPKPFVVMAYGRLSRKRKGTHLVVKACEKLCRKGYDIKLLLFDTPVDHESVVAIENFSCKVPFEFIRNHPIRENVSLFHRADVFVSAERKAGWSNTTAEAMASGIPVISTVSGTRDFLIDGETGLTTWRHSYFIAKNIRKLVENKELRAHLALNGRKKIEEFSWEKLGERILDYLEH